MSTCRGTYLGCRFAHDQFGIDLNDVREFFVGQLFEQGTGCQSAHVLQGLTDRRQARNNVGGGLNIVEAKDGDVGGHLEPSVVKSSNAADCRNVIEAEYCCKVPAPQQQLVDPRITKFRSVEVFVS